MATVEQLTIQFEGKGAPKLTGQLNALSAAMNRLASRQNKANKASKKLHKKAYLISLIRFLTFM